MDLVSSYIVNKNDFVSAMEEMEIRAIEKFAMRFYAYPVDTKFVASLHSVSERTICRYVERGLIQPLERNSSKGNYKFRLSDVLQIDIDKLRKTI